MWSLSAPGCRWGMITSLWTTPLSTRWFHLHTNSPIAFTCPPVAPPIHPYLTLNCIQRCTGMLMWHQSSYGPFKIPLSPSRKESAFGIRPQRKHYHLHDAFMGHDHNAVLWSSISSLSENSTCLEIKDLRDKNGDKRSQNPIIRSFGLKPKQFFFLFLQYLFYFQNLFVLHCSSKSTKLLAGLIKHFSRNAGSFGQSEHLCHIF